jgi:hypothetical protein
MNTKDLKNKQAKDQYGEKVTILEVNEDIVYTDKGTYHASKLFIDGKSIQTLLNK